MPAVAKDKTKDAPVTEATAAPVTEAPAAPVSDGTPTEGDGRSKVDHQWVLDQKAAGVKPSDIAKQKGIAVGTVYKILRESGQGSGRTISRSSGSRGVNVSAEVTALIDRLQTTVDNADADKEAEAQRHAEALKSIDAESLKARTALESLASLREAVSDPEPEVSEAVADSNGTPTE